MCDAFATYWFYWGIYEQWELVYGGILVNKEMRTPQKLLGTKNMRLNAIRAIISGCAVIALTAAASAADMPMKAPIHKVGDWQG